MPAACRGRSSMRWQLTVGAAPGTHSGSSDQGRVCIDGKVSQSSKAARPGQSVSGRRRRFVLAGMHPRGVAQQNSCGANPPSSGSLSKKHQPSARDGAGTQPAPEQPHLMQASRRGNPVLPRPVHREQPGFRLHQHFPCQRSQPDPPESRALRASQDLDDGPVGLRFARQSGTDKVPTTVAPQA